MNTTNDTPTPELENRLRTEFADRASRASGADRILTTLAGQQLQLRPRRKTPAIGRWVTVAAAVAIVAAGIPIAVHLAGPPPPNPNPNPAATSLRTDTAYPLTYQAAWLPPGFVVSGRSASVDGATQSRSWINPESSAALQKPTITLSVLSASSLPGQSQLDGIRQAKHPIDINGHRGYVLMGGDNATIAWQPNQDTVLMIELTSVSSGTTTAEQIARSVTLNQPAQVSAGMSFGHLPAAYQPFSQSVTGTQHSPERTIGAVDGPLTPGLADVTATLSSIENQPPIPDGRPSPVTARGRSATYLAGEGDTAVNVRLADGRWLSVVSSPRAQTPPMSEDQLIAIANNITIGPPPDLTWLTD